MKFSPTLPPPQISSIFHQTIKQIVPKSSELIKMQNLISDTIEVINSSRIPPEISLMFIEPQGSTGIKQTALTNAADIDLFIGLDPTFLFESKFSSKKVRRDYIRKLFKNLVSDWLIPTLKENHYQNVRLSYAEHPYVSAELEGVEIDLVCCFDLSSQYIHENGPITAVDRSPHHSRFIRDHLSKSQKDDVRLLKYFFKCHHCYGDQSAIGRSGFIGYSAELLIHLYSSIWGVFCNFDKLNSKILYSSEMLPEYVARYQNKSFADIRKRFFPNDFLILIDPTDAKRNVGSSISSRAYYLMKSKIQQFMANPDASFFRKERIPSILSLHSDKKTLNCLYYVEYHETEEDHYTKYRDKLYHLMEKLIRKAEQEATLEDRFPNVEGELIFDAKKGIYVIALHAPQPVISEEYIRTGPAVSDEPHYSRFVSAHPDAYDCDGFLCINVKRKFTTFLEYLQNEIPNNPISNLKVFSIGSASTPPFSDMAAQSMGNFYVNVLPFL
ncbi:hypothetical protein NEF87_001180 [Candidatus Lokiarchaeum ossiferum]|uniref:tRNA nucleotidyltransferase substrate binding domain-containing protein n=1 Tax=Candidatus Lokiarchaeum ossiferum TaxID=2951803 RepID=A0ABY6HN02_9ARCH|nr:hypothetical protein NEF87_001180 [Candidatus Lokiarchaeum sp. B-35]